MDPRQLAAAPSETTLDPLAPIGKEQSAERLRALYDIGRQLVEQRQAREVIEAIQSALIGHLLPDHACVLALAGGELRPLATHRLDLSGPLEQWPISRTVLARVQESGLAVLATDVQRDPRFEESGSVQRLGIRSVMCVPLGPQPACGLIYVDSRRGHSFVREDLEFLIAIAGYASPTLERALEQEETAAALRASRERLELLEGELLRHRIVSRSPALLSAYDTVQRLARAGARVLLRGETGTGKELFARAYAQLGPRGGGPYVPVPIPALAPTLVESELFGHVRGAFTEAARDKKGRLELAHGGVLFFDEIGDVDLALQAKLLRFLDSGELFRVGDTERRVVDALVVSATNRDLEKDIQAGRFRGDLLARLGHVVQIPPLRQRADDIPVLIEHFLGVYARGRGPKRFSDEAVSLLLGHHWPFNVRELQLVVERSCCLVDEEVVDVKDLPDYLRRPSLGRVSSTVEGAPVERPLAEVVEAAEREHILRVLEKTKGNRRKAIAILRIAPETFYRRLQEFGLRGRDE